MTVADGEKRMIDITNAEKHLLENSTKSYCGYLKACYPRCGSYGDRQ